MTDRTKFVIGLVMLTTAVAVGVWQYGVMSGNQIMTDSLNADVEVLESIQQNLIDDYQEIKVEVSDSREAAVNDLALVFPTDEDITNLTRMFDDFAVKNNFTSNPFFISSISYQGSQEVEEGYRYVPLTVSVTSSEKNLGEFIEFIETSGSLEGETRLMSIGDMTLSYPAEYGGTYDVKFTINAYFSQEVSA
jgi:hypothetical protein